MLLEFADLSSEKFSISDGFSETKYDKLSMAFIKWIRGFHFQKKQRRGLVYISVIV
jgi:hypothetical protein